MLWLEPARGCDGCNPLHAGALARQYKTRAVVMYRREAIGVTQRRSEADVLVKRELALRVGRHYSHGETLEWDTGVVSKVFTRQEHQTAENPRIGVSS